MEIILKWLTGLAVSFLDWMQSREYEKFKQANPEFSVDMGLRRVEVGSHEWEMVMTHPGVYMMADQAAAFLETNNAKNFVQFDMMPRLDRGMRPVRVTVQWVDGLSPAVKCANLEKELAQYRDSNERAERRIKQYIDVLAQITVAVRLDTSKTIEQVVSELPTAVEHLRDQCEAAQAKIELYKLAVQRANAELDQWRYGQVTEEMLRRQPGGAIAVGNDCEIAARGTTDRLNTLLNQ